MKISDILSSKGNDVITIKESAPLSLALEKLVTNKIGVLIVLNDDGGIAGILSERDVLRASFTAPDEYLENLSGAYMTSDVIFAEPDDSIDYAENMMTNNRFRHLPVIKDGKLMGLISIGDIVKAQLSESRDETKYLKDYISGNA